MVSLGALWLPIVLSAVLVFVAQQASSPWCSATTTRITPRCPTRTPCGPRSGAGIRRPKQYVIPYCEPKDMGSPRPSGSSRRVPSCVLNLKPTGSFGMGPSLVQWFVFSLVLSFFVAYVASHALPAGSGIPAGVPDRGRGLRSWGTPPGNCRPPSGWASRGWWPEESVRRAGVRAGDGGRSFGWLWPR